MHRLICIFVVRIWQKWVSHDVANFTLSFRADPIKLVGWKHPKVRVTVPMSHVMRKPVYAICASYPLKLSRSVWVKPGCKSPENRFSCSHSPLSLVSRSWLSHIWATSWENLLCAICEQQRCRSACASAQSDQRLCCSMPTYYNTYTLSSSIQNLKTLASFCSWASWFESYPAANSQRHIFSWRRD